MPTTTNSTDESTTTGLGVTLALCFAVAMLEGLDIQAMGVAAPALGAELKLSRDTLGRALSASNIGLVIGASLGGWFADRFGRKPVLVVATALFGVFTLSTMFAFNYETLFAARLCAGIGFGAALSNLMAVAAEVSGSSRRGATGSMLFCGMPVGGGTVALISWLTPAQNWRTLFLIGGAAPVLLAPLLFFFMKETRGPIAVDRSKESSSRAGWLGIVPLYGLSWLAAIFAAKLPGIGSLAGMAPWLAIPPTVVLAYLFINRDALFRGGRAFTSLLVWAIFLPTLLILFLVLNWLPTLVGAKGFPQDASQASMWFNYVSIPGALMFGFLVDRFGMRWPLVTGYGGLIATLFLLSAATGRAPILILSGVLGFFLIGAHYALYALAASYYAKSIRGRGAGAAIGVGRLGSVVGPLVGGYLLAAGASAASVVYSMVPFAVIAGASVLLLSFVSAD